MGVPSYADRYTLRAGMPITMATGRLFRNRLLDKAFQEVNIKHAHPAYKPRKAGFGVSSLRGGNVADGCVCIRKRMVSTEMDHYIIREVDGCKNMERTRMTDHAGQYRTCRRGEEHGWVYQFEL
jgi:hypothetical protein